MQILAKGEESITASKDFHIFCFFGLTEVLCKYHHLSHILIRWLRLNMEYVILKKISFCELKAVIVNSVFEYNDEVYLKTFEGRILIFKLFICL